MRYLVILITCFVTVQLFSQECGFDYLPQYSNFPKVKAGAPKSANCNGPFTIPIVVHVVHSNGISNPDANWFDNSVSEFQLRQFIKCVNQVIAVSNPAMNIQIKVSCHNDSNISSIPIFHHASDYYTNLDINPNPSINEGVGMMNTYNTANILAQYPTSKYLHIWIVNNITNSAMSGNGNGIAGYASFPNMAGQITDGIVIEASQIVNNSGTSSNCFILAHEIGHYLSLFHTFQGGCSQPGDLCDDTPPDDFAGDNCTITENTCHPSWEIPDLTDAQTNIMDYGDPSCRNTLTSCQYNRMNVALCDDRPGLLTSNGLVCTCPDTFNFTFNLNAQYNASDSIHVNINPSNIPSGYARIYKLNGNPISLSNNRFVVNLLGDYVLTVELVSNTNPDCRFIWSDYFKIKCADTGFNSNFTYTPNPISVGAVTTFTAATGSGFTYLWNIGGQSYTGNNAPHTFNVAGCNSVSLTISNGTCIAVNNSTVNICSCPNNIGFENGLGNATSSGSNVAVIGAETNPILGQVTPIFGSQMLRLGNNLPSNSNNIDVNKVFYTYVPTASSDKLIIAVNGYAHSGHNQFPDFVPLAAYNQHAAGFYIDVNSVPSDTSFNHRYSITCYNSYFIAANNRGFPNMSPNPINGIMRTSGWRIFEYNLSCFIGQTITIELGTTDCFDGNHNGMAYFDMKCGDAEIEKPPVNAIPDTAGMCKGNPITFILPDAFCSAYSLAYTPATGVSLGLGNSTTRLTLNPDTTTTYRLIYSRSNCYSDTDYVTIKVQPTSKSIKTVNSIPSRLICQKDYTITPFDVAPDTFPSSLVAHYEWYFGTNTPPLPEEYIPNSNWQRFDTTIVIPYTGSNTAKFLHRKLVIESSSLDSCYEAFTLMRIQYTGVLNSSIPAFDTCENSIVKYQVLCVGPSHNILDGGSYFFIDSATMIEKTPELVLQTLPVDSTASYNNPDTLSFTFNVKFGKSYFVRYNYHTPHVANCSFNTNDLPIGIFPLVGNPGIISTSNACLGSNDTFKATGTDATSLINTTSPFIYYQWKYRINGGQWINITNATNKNLSGFLFTGLYGMIEVVREAYSLNCNSALLSNILIVCGDGISSNIITVNDTTSCGVTINGNLPTSTSVCDTSGFNFQWQSSSDSVNFIDIPNANTQNLSLTTNLYGPYYRRRASCGCCDGIISNVVFQNALTTSAGIIQTPVLVCSRSNSYAISSIKPVTTNCSCAIIRWYRSSVSGNGPWTLIPNENGQTLSGNLPSYFPDTVYFKRVVDIPCANPPYTLSSNVSLVIKLNGLEQSAGIITSNTYGSYCLGSNVVLTGPNWSNPGNFCTPTYEWSYSYSGVQYIPIPNSNMPSYSFQGSQYNSPTGEVYFKRIVNFSCTFDSIIKSCGPYQAHIYLKLCTSPSGTTIDASQSSCLLPFQPDSLRLKPNTISAPCCYERYKYQWQASSNGVSFIDIPYANGLTYLPPNIITNNTIRYYRLKVNCYESTTNGCEGYSNIVSISTSPSGGSWTGGTIAQSQKVNINQLPALLYNLTSGNCTCTNNTHVTRVYSWQRKIGTGSWITLANTNSANHQPITSSFTGFHYYRRLTQCSNQTLPKYSAPLTVEFIFIKDTILKSSSSINTIDGKPKFNFELKPNPANNKIAVITNMEPSTQAIIQINDQKGSILLLLQRNISAANPEIIDVSGLVSGTYFLTLSIGGYQETKKFIVEK